MVFLVLKTKILLIIFWNHCYYFLTQVRPLLNMVKLTFPRYLVVGNEIALDEAGVSSRSRFGSGLISYNPSKPGGKFHFKFYMVCDVDTYACLRIRLHTRDKSDTADPPPEGPTDHPPEENSDNNNTPDKSKKVTGGLKTTGLPDDDHLPEESNTNDSSNNNNNNKPTIGLIHALV